MEEEVECSRRVSAFRGSKECQMAHGEANGGRSRTVTSLLNDHSSARGGEHEQERELLTEGRR